MKTNRTSSQAAQTVFLLVFAALIGYKLKGSVYFLYIAILFCVGGFLSHLFVTLVDKSWMKLGWVLGQIVPRILLSVIFYFIVTPLGLFSRWMGDKDAMQLKKPNRSLFKENATVLDKESFKKMW